MMINYGVLIQGCTAESDMSSIYYSVMGLKLLGEAVNNKEQLCAAAAKLADDTSVGNYINRFELNFFNIIRYK